MTVAAAMLLAEEDPNAMTLPFDAIWFWILAMVVFFLLLGITYAFRNTAARYRDNPEIFGTDAAAASSRGHH